MTGAAVAIGAIASTAQAAITYHETPGVSSSDAVGVNPLTGQAAVLPFNPPFVSSTYPIAFWSSGGFSDSGFSNGDDSSSIHASALPVGSMVDGNLSYVTGNYLSLGSAPSQFYVAFRYQNQGVGNDETYYGYVELEKSGATYTMIGYAISDTDGESLTTQSVVPEPSTYALGFGALVLAGFVCYKRYKGRIASLLSGA